MDENYNADPNSIGNEDSLILFNKKIQYIEIDLADNELIETAESVTEISVGNDIGGITEELPINDIIIEDLEEPLPIIADIFENEEFLIDSNVELNNNIIYDINVDFPFTPLIDELPNEKALLPTEVLTPEGQLMGADAENQIFDFPLIDEPPEKRYVEDNEVYDNNWEYNDSKSYGEYEDTENNEHDYTDDEDDILSDITNSLAQQAVEELAPVSETAEADKKIPKWLIILCSALGFLILTCIFLTGTNTGRRLILKIAASYVEGKVKYDDGSSQEIIDIEDDIDLTEDDLSNKDLNIISDDDIDLNTDDIDAAYAEEVINILILGEETIESGTARGRTDLIMIASINASNKTYSLISLMRDMYVEIPGHDGNKLNAAYQIGGIQLLYSTIEKNFKIKIDGYCLVGFDVFENIINQLGGLTVALSSSEAEYLRNTNYISNPIYRNVVTGRQLLNGNQVLGYCRVRHVPTSTEADDFGRTQRQRIVMNALFDKVKAMSYLDMLKLVDNSLPLITTDLDSNEVAAYMETAIEIGFSSITNLRIPAEGTYETGYVRKMQVLIPNLADNITLIHNTLFGLKE